MAQVDLKNSTITFVPGNAPGEGGADALGVPLVVKIGEGNLTYTEARPIEYMRDRGILDEVRLDKPVPLEVNLDAVWIAIGTDVQLHPAGGGAPVTATYDKDYFMETLRGSIVGNDSSDADATRPFAVHIDIEYVTTGATPNTKIRLPDFRYEAADFDLDAGTIALNGKCFTRQAIITETA